MSDQPHTLTGLFRSHQNFTSKYVEPTHDVLVYLPPDYEDSPERCYPVLYLQDGQNIFDGATAFIPGQEWRVDETAEALIRGDEIEPLIIVGIYNAGAARMDEYTPTRDPKIGQGGKADQYGRMMIEELKPFIDSEYRTCTDASKTGLGGSSLGGLLTLHLGIRHPNVFGRLAVLSPSVWWDRRRIVREVQALREKTRSKIWLDIGTGEGKTATQNVRLLRDALEQKGWEHGVDLAYFEAEGADHSEGAWAARIDSILRFLYPR